VAVMLSDGKSGVAGGPAYIQQQPLPQPAPAAGGGGGGGGAGRAEPHQSEWVPQDWTSAKRQALLDVLCRFEIQDAMGTRIRRLLAGQKKVLVLDNSSSMNRAVMQSSLMPNKPVTTRNDELLVFVELALPFLAAESPDGIEVWLLNQVGGATHGHPGPVVVRNVHTVEQIKPYLQQPYGRTPLVQCLQSLFHTCATSIAEEGLHVLVATDGEPDDCNGMAGRTAMFELLRQGSAQRRDPSKCIVNFLVCTDNDDDVAYLDHIDSACPFVDVTDDYASERDQVAKKRTLPRPLSVADWVLKALIGAADPTLDALDESKGGNNKDCVIL
jgi:hypothetical protein